jgi:hypothetical protein
VPRSSQKQRAKYALALNTWLAKWDEVVVLNPGHDLNTKIAHWLDTNFDEGDYAWIFTCIDIDAVGFRNNAAALLFRLAFAPIVRESVDLRYLIRKIDTNAGRPLYLSALNYT